MIFRDKTAESNEEIDDAELQGDASNESNAVLKIAELETALGEAKEQLLRRTAEMENMRRRFNQEREQLIFESNKRLLTDLLPTLDDMERTLDHAGSGKEAVLQAMELIHKNFVKLLERYGVTPMQTVGTAFDVHAHDALMQEESEDASPGTVLKEIQRGYVLNDNVLRHAKVIVAKDSE